MAITLSDGLVTVTLPADLLWIDRHTWSPVEQAEAVSITGATLIDNGVRLSGRPITLESGEAHAWIPYADVTQIKAWAAVAGKELTLNLHSTTYTVIFAHHNRPAVDLQPVIDYAIPDAADWFFGQLKFMEI